MRKKQHPLSGAVYTDLGDGRVHVEKRGVEGIFSGADARWLEGELTHADPHMLLWVGGRMPGGTSRPARAPEPELLRD